MDGLSAASFQTGGFGGACITVFLIPYQGGQKLKGSSYGRSSQSTSALSVVQLNFQVLRSEFGP